MNGFRNWMARVMMGRYGSDELNRFLLIIGAILIIIGLFVHKHILNVLVVAVLILVYCRMFSRNIGKRQEENVKYLEMKAKVTGGRGGGSTSYGRPGTAGGYRGSASAGTGSHRSRKKKVQPGKRMFICPYCKGALQVPVGAGRIRIKCPHCGREFEETV